MLFNYYIIVFSAMTQIMRTVKKRRHAILIYNFHLTMGQSAAVVF